MECLVIRSGTQKCDSLRSGHLGLRFRGPSVLYPKQSLAAQPLRPTDHLVYSDGLSPLTFVWEDKHQLIAPFVNSSALDASVRVCLLSCIWQVQQGHRLHMVIIICCKNPVLCVMWRIIPSNTVVIPNNKALMFVWSAGLALECTCIIVLLSCVKSAEWVTGWVRCSLAAKWEQSSDPRFHVLREESGQRWTKCVADCETVLLESVINLWCPIHGDFSCNLIFVFKCFGCGKNIWVRFSDGCQCTRCGNWSDWDRIDRSAKFQQAICRYLANIKNQWNSSNKGIATELLSFYEKGRRTV